MRSTPRIRHSPDDRASQRCGWATCAASLRRPAPRAGSPALGGPEARPFRPATARRFCCSSASTSGPWGAGDNSGPGTGPRTRRRRRGVPLQPRCAALPGAAEAQHPPPTRTSAGTDGAARKSATNRDKRARSAARHATRRCRQAHDLARWLWSERPIAAPKRSHSPVRGLACAVACGKTDEKDRTGAVA